MSNEFEIAHITGSVAKLNKFYSNSELDANTRARAVPLIMDVVRSGNVDAAQFMFSRFGNLRVSPVMLAEIACQTNSSNMLLYIINLFSLSAQTASIDDTHGLLIAASKHIDVFRILHCTYKATNAHITSDILYVVASHLRQGDNGSVILYIFEEMEFRGPYRLVRKMIDELKKNNKELANFVDCKFDDCCF